MTTKSLSPAELDAVRLHARLWSQLDWGGEACILDVGAHNGETAIEYLREFPLAQVVAIEANPEKAMLLQSLHPGRLQVFAVAAGAQSGSQMFIIRQGSANSSFREVRAVVAPKNSDYQIVDRVEVPVMTVDQISKAVGQAVNILKIDTEGFELEVIEGAKETLANPSCFIVSCEVFFSPAYIGQPLHHEIVAALQSQSFRFHSYTRLIHTASGNLYFGDATFVSERHWGTLGLL